MYCFIHSHNAIGYNKFVNIQRINMKIICECQHEIDIPDSTDQLRVDMLSSKPCPKCASAETGTSSAQGKQLPRLKGSAKQTAWAYEIREKVQDQFREFRAEYSRKKFTLTRKQQEFHLIAVMKSVRAFRKETKAAYWIEHQDLRDIII